MSFSACANSSLVPIPPKYPPVSSNDVGSIIIPTLAYIQYPNNGTLDVFSPSLTLPIGVWLVSGFLEIGAVAGNVSQAIVTITIDGLIQGRNVALGATPSISVPFSVIVSSGSSGAADICSLLVQVTTSGGANWEVVNQNTSIVKCVRIA